MRCGRSGAPGKEGTARQLGGSGDDGEPARHRRARATSISWGINYLEMTRKPPGLANRTGVRSRSRQ